MRTQQSTAIPSHQILSRLAQDDPHAFEALCTSLIERCIDNAPDRIQPRLRQLQFRVDGIRRRSRSPLGALLKIQALMWESFLHMDQELQNYARQSTGASSLPEPTAVQRAAPVRSARVIEFRPAPGRKTG